MWVFLLSESKVVMWFLFSKHFTNEGPGAHVELAIQWRVCLCVGFVSSVLVCPCEIVCVGI